MAQSINEFGLSFAVERFDATRKYFENVLGFAFVLEWNEPQKGRRGAYFHVGGIGVIEIYDASARGEKAPPPRDAFALLITVDDVAETLSRIVSAGGTVDSALVEEPYGSFFSVRDPSGIAICFMERRGEGKRRFDALLRHGKT